MATSTRKNGMSEHAALIDKLGGPTALAGELGQAQSTVSMWKARGIPWRWRHVIADLAKGRKVALPKGFFEAAA